MSMDTDLVVLQELFTAYKTGECVPSRDEAIEHLSAVMDYTIAEAAEEVDKWWSVLTETEE